jgi:hypothetical protein
LHSVNEPWGHGFVLKLCEQEETVIHGPVNGTSEVSVPGIAFFRQEIGPLLMCPFHIGIIIKELAGAEGQTIPNDSQLIGTQVLAWATALTKHGIDEV